MLEVGRGSQGVGRKVLPQPCAYAIADRLVRPAVDLFAVVGGKAIHDKFRCVSVSTRWHSIKSPGSKLFPARIEGGAFW
jgi:hypothetical protein